MSILIETTIRETFAQWTDAWNAGDLEEHLVCYAVGDETVYVGSKIIRGQAAIANHFRERFPISDHMGKLTVKSLEIDVIDSHHAHMIGQFEHQLAQSTSEGVFTLYLKQIEGQWRIVVDHSSALG